MAAASAGTHKINAGPVAIPGSAVVMSRGHLVQQQQVVMQQHSQQHQQQQLHQHQHVQHHSSNAAHQHQQQQQPAVLLQHHQQQNVHFQMQHQNHSMVGQSVSGPNHHSQQPHSGVHHASPSQPHQQHPQQQQHQQRQQSFVPRIGQNPNGMQIIANNVIARQQLHQNQFPHHQHQQQHQTQIQQNYTHSQLLSHQRQQQQQSQVHPSSELTEASTGGKVQHQQPLKIPPPPTIASRHALASKQQTSARGTTPPSVSVGTPSANLAPGWLRINANNEIIYISPTGANLRSQVQIRDYLLSPGTCKCGLPCPLRPEFFFDFNSQVPNIPLKVPPENGLPTRSLACLHQRRFLESSHHQQQQQQHQEHQQIDQLQHQSQQQQQLLHGQNHSQQQSPHHQQQVAHHQQQPQHQQQEHLEQQKQQQQQQHEQSGLKDAKRRKFTLPTTNPNKILSATQQNTSPTIYATSSSPVQGTSQMVSMDKTQQHIESLSGKTTPVDMQKVQIATTNVPTPNQTISSDKPERQIGGVTLSKTPPWRKSQTATSGYSSENNERVPPLPPAHLEPSKGLSTAPPWQGATQPGYVPRFYTKNRLLTGITKKFPNFKDDPTGYLSQQTALLHNSMLNVVQAPKDMDGEEVDEIRETSTSKTVIHHQQQQQQQHQHQQQQPQPHPQPQQAHHQQAENSMFSVDAKHPHYSNTSTSSQAQQHPQQQQQQPHPELVQSSNSNFLSQYQPPQQQPSTQQVPATIPSVTSTGNRHMIVPSSQQQQYHEQAEATKADAATEKRRIYPTPGQQQQQQEPLAQVQQQAQSQTHLTTSIGGQTVTQFPNGMVQIKQTCDRIAPQIIQTPMKPQQQLQLQQQIQQHNILFRQNQQIQKQTNNSNKQPKPTITVPAAQESPVSSSTTFPNRSTPETSQQHQQILSDNSKGPAQVGAISTSHESPRPCPPSPAESTESTSSRASIKTAPSPSLIQNPHVVTSKKVESQKVLRQQKASQQSLYMQTASRNTITSVTAGKTPTATTTSSTTNIESQNKIQHHSQKLSPNSNIPITNLQLQPVLRDSSNSQIIMTSTGQLIVMPSTSSIKTQQQLSGNHHMIISSGNSDNNATIHQNVDVQQQILNGTSANASNSNGSIIIQNAGGSNNFQIQGSNIQPTTVILNNGQNLLGTGTKVLTNGGNILNNISGNIISPNNTGMLGQQTVVLNTLPNGYVIQPNFATVDGQVVSQIVNQENGATTYVQQPQSQQQHTQRIIITSPDIKRKAKKRKNSSSSSPSTTPSSLSPQQSPTIQQQAATVLQNHQNNGQAQVVQISTGPQYPTQGFQISPGIQGIVVNKNAQSPAPQQQILFQNGQIIQPINMLGQQLLVPAGLVMATPDTTLLQIQNVGTACGSILTPQGMMLRAASPQNKNFLSPSGGGQQFIVGNNGQLSPIGQIYSTPMGIMMPSQGNGGTTTYVQQNATIVQHQHQQQQQQPAHQQQQQQHQQHQAQAIQQQSQVVQHQSVSIQQQQQLHHQQHVQQQQPQHSNNQTITVINKRLLDEVANVQRTAAASPPDTTTHSPRSPERPPSQRSGGSDMVQCVSSSEPDGVVSPQSVDSAQSPTTTDCDRGVSYQTTNVYKPSDAKMRRVKSPAQHTYGSSTQDIMKPDSHESPTNSPPASSSMPAISSTIHKTNSTASNRTIKSVSTVAVPSDFIHNGVHKSFAIGELIWGAARGHPAWPGKIVNPPDGISTPRDYQNESIWVQWFGGGGRSHAELVAVNTLKSLSEGLEAHHKAQKDTRKSRKLNSQLERAIQEAMTELDRISAAPSGNNCSQPTSTSPSSIQTANSGSAKNRGRGRTTISQSLTQQRSKPIRIAPAPPNATTIINPANSTSLNGTKQQATTSINQVSSQQHQLHQHHQSQTQTK